MQFRRLLLPLSVSCCLALVYTVSPAQDRSAQPQSRPAPGGKPGGPPPGGGNPGGGRPPNGGMPQNPGNGAGRPPGGNPGGGRPPGNGSGRPPGGGGGNNRPNPRPTPPRPNPSRPNPGRPPQWGRPPVSRPNYRWRPNDRVWLHHYYGRNLGYINIATRPRFVVGGFFPYGYVPYITPAPPAVLGYLPPVPPGYQIGYYQGYVVVYDPVTYFIANVIDLMQ